MKDRILLTTPAEIARITDDAAFAFEMEFSGDVFHEYKRTHKEYADSFLSPLTAVYMAGRVQGIREERARRAQKKTALAVNLIHDARAADESDEIISEFDAECIESQSGDLFKVGQTYKILKRKEKGLGVHDSDGLSNTLHNAWNVDETRDGAFAVSAGEGNIMARFVKITRAE